MKFLADENLLEGIVDYLRSNDYQVVNVKGTALAGSSDKKLYELAVKENYIILSMDKDFTRLLMFPPNLCGGIIVCKLYKMYADEAIAIFKRFFSTLSQEDIQGNLVVITRTGTKIKRINNE